MVKKTISITIEIETYLNIIRLKQGGKEINISNICENALNSILANAEKEEQPSDLIEKQLQKKKEEILDLNLQLNKAQGQEKKNEEEQIEKAKALQAGLKTTEVLNFD